MWDPALPSQIAQSALRYPTPQERRAFIANACQGDTALQQQVLVTLAAFEAAQFHNPALSNPALSNPALSNPALSNPALQNPALSNPALSLPSRPLPGMPMGAPSYPQSYQGANFAKPKGSSKKTWMIVGGIVGGVTLLLLLIASPFAYSGYKAWSLSSAEKRAAEARKFGKFKESAEAYEQLEGMYKAKYGPTDDKTLDMMVLLGNAYHLAGMNDKARPKLMEVGELQKNKLGPTNSKTIRTVFYLADVLRKEKKAEEELMLLEETIKTARATPPVNEDLVARCIDVYVDACLALGQRKRALSAEEELVDYFRMRAGANHPQTQDHVVRLVNTYNEAGKSDQAVKLAEANLSTIKQIFGENSSQNLDALQGLAKACDALQRKDDAIKWRQAYEAAKLAPPPSEPYSFGYPVGGGGSGS